jgi:hypothetical protein
VADVVLLSDVEDVLVDVVDSSLFAAACCRASDNRWSIDEICDEDRLVLDTEVIGRLLLKVEVKAFASCLRHTPLTL